jgi:hypothetical protein
MPQIPVTIRTAIERPLVKVVNDLIQTPAPGLGFAITIPLGYRTSIVCLRFRFVSDANVSDRFLTLSIANNAGILYQHTNIVALVASETDTMVYGSGLPNVAKSATNHNSLVPLPAGLTLEEGDTLTITIAGVQVGDQIDQIVMQSLSQFVAE